MTPLFSLMLAILLTGAILGILIIRKATVHTNRPLQFLGSVITAGAVIAFGLLIKFVIIG